MKKNSALFALLVAITILTPGLTLAAVTKAGETVVVTQEGGIQDNLYVAGGEVQVDTSISGDLVTAGGNILITKDVSEDIAAVGGSVTILGSSKEDVRVAGGNVLISGNVGGDLIVAGGTVVISSGVTIGKDLIVTGGTVTLNGVVLGNATIAGGEVRLNSEVKGNVKANVGKLTLGEKANINGNLEYKAQDLADLEKSPSAIIGGETIFKEMKNVTPEVDKGLMAIFGIFAFISFLASILLALISFFVFKKFSNNVVTSAITDPLHLMLKGFVVLVTIPVAIVLLFITLFGVPIALMALLSYILLICISGIYTGIITGAWLSKKVYKSEEIKITWKNIISGVVVLALVKAIPFIGWIIGFAVFLIALGSIFDILHKKVWKDR